MRKRGAKSGRTNRSGSAGLGRKQLSMTRALPEENGALCLRAAESSPSGKRRPLLLPPAQADAGAGRKL